MADTRDPFEHPQGESDALADLLAAIEEREARMRHEQPSEEWWLEVILEIGVICLINRRSYEEDLVDLLGVDRDTAEAAARQLGPRCAERLLRDYPHLPAR